MIFYILSFFFLIALIGLLYHNGDSIYEASNHILPVLLRKVAIISLTIITLLFGMQTDIFSKYSRYIGEDGSKYNWFLPADILRFPVEQYGINTKEVYPKNNISFDNSFKNNLPTRKITIILDKTGSVNETDEKNPLKMDLIKELKSNVDGYSRANVDESKIHLQDLFFLIALKNIIKENQFDNKTQVQILFYLGSKTVNGEEMKPHLEKKVFSNFDDNDKNSTGDRDRFIIDNLIAIEAYNSPKIRAKINRRATDFCGLGEELRKKIYQYNIHSKTETFSHKSLIILSDFLHEEDKSGRSLVEVENSWSKFGNAYSQINLISFKGDNGQQNDPKPGQTINILRRTLNHLYFSHYDEYLENEFNPADEINTMFSSVINSRKVRPIYVYESPKREKSKYDYHGNITIEKSKNIKDNTFIISFTGRVRPNDYIKPQHYLTLEEKYSNLPYQSKIYENQRGILKSNALLPNYELSFWIDDIGKEKYFLEITYPKASYILRYPIIFEPVLSETSSLALFILYFLIIFSFCYSGLYILSDIYKEKIDKNKKRVFFWTTLLPFVYVSISLLGFLIINTYNLCEFNPDLISNLFVFILFGGVFIGGLHKVSKKYKILKSN